jgi:hypothetical protein
MLTWNTREEALGASSFYVDALKSNLFRAGPTSYGVTLVMRPSG